jgi:hypothetical protein
VKSQCSIAIALLPLTSGYTSLVTVGYNLLRL